jgi:hypothetical protein
VASAPWPPTLLKFHAALVERKHRRLFSSSPSPRRKSGPEGLPAELIAAIIALKRRNPHFGCVRIAQQIARAFGVEIDKDVVRRVLAKHHGTGDSDTTGPSRTCDCSPRGDTCARIHLQVFVHSLVSVSDGDRQPRAQGE